MRALYWLATADFAPTSDADSYHDIARNLADGLGFAHRFPELSVHRTAFRAPLFPVVLAGPYFVFGASVGLARAINLVIGVLVVLLVERLVIKLGGEVAGLAAAIVVAVYPPLVVNDVTVLAESLSLFLLVAMFLALHDQRWVLAGVEAGLLMLTRHSAQVFVLVVALFVLQWLGWRRALGFVGVACVVVTPWVVRNQVQLGEPVLNTANGFNLAAAYSQESHEDDDFVDPVFDRRFDDLRFVQFDEAAWDRELRDRGLDGLREHPLQPLRVMSRNSMRYFELKPWENEDAEDLDGRNLTIRRLTLPMFYIVTALGLAGLWLGRRNRVVVLIMATGAYFSLTSLLSVSAPRLRSPFDLACCIGLGLLVGEVWKRRQVSSPGDSRVSPAAPR